MEKSVGKFLIHGKNHFTIQDLMDDIGHEIQRLSKLEKETMTPVEKDIALLRMLKSDLRNIVKRYETLECLI